ncbi:MAG: hypothetical protein O6831_09770 [Alphaproteobacteria bacterium]|nr:hypothetical protein [Alphaproteobacteria bacterium]
MVAKLDGVEEATFRKYEPQHDESGHEIIDPVPLNDDFPTITIDSKYPDQ